MKLTDLARSAVEAADDIRWRTAEQEEGQFVLSTGGDQPQEIGIELSDDDSVEIAGAKAVALGMWGKLSLYRPGATSYEDSQILRAHIGAVRFPPGTEPADILDLRPAPDSLIWMGDHAPSFALWGLVDPVEGADLLAMVPCERDRFGGDPDWEASPSSLIPICGVVYVIDGAEYEAREWPMTR